VSNPPQDQLVQLLNDPHADPDAVALIAALRFGPRLTQLAPITFLGSARGVGIIDLSRGAARLGPYDIRLQYAPAQVLLHTAGTSFPAITEALRDYNPLAELVVIVFLPRAMRVLSVPNAPLSA
jgi:hypothetical protein